MAASQIIPVDDTAADSNEITVTAGIPVAVGLNTSDDASAIPAGAEVLVLLKDANSQYWQCGKLSAAKPVAVLSVPGVYLLRRLPRANSNVGAFRAA